MASPGGTMRCIPVLVGLCALAAGCGGKQAARSGDDGGAVADTSSVDTFLRQLAQNQCDWELRCCKDAEIKLIEKGRPTDAMSCVAFHLLDAKDSLWLERYEVGAGRMKSDDAGSAAC